MPRGYKRKKSLFTHRKKYRRFGSSSKLAESHLSSTSESDPDSSSASNSSELPLASCSTENCSSIDGEIENFEHFASFPLATSSPIPFDVSPSDSTSSDSVVTSDTSDTQEQLYANSDLSISNFSEQFLSIVSKHRLSDIAASDMLKLVTQALPCPNMCPTLSQINASLKDEFEDIRVIPVTDGKYYLLDMENQVSKIIERNPNIFDKPKEAADVNYHDIHDGETVKNLCGQDGNNVLYLYVIANSDGVCPRHKSKGCHFWPFTFSIINLPPSERRKFANLVFCCFYYGQKKPDFIVFLQNVVNHVQNFKMEFKDKIVCFKVISFLADLPAKAACLNMTQFNGYYGCSVCEIKGTYSPQYRKMIYPPEKELNDVRKSIDHPVYVNQSKLKKPCMGVKGPSPLSDLIQIPTQSVIDPMHLVYLGITKTLFTYLITKKILSQGDISNVLLSMSVPLCFKRKPRSLEQMKFWKASEWKHFLLYYSLIALHVTKSSNEIVVITGLLSTGIYLLSSNNVTDADITTATVLLLAFQKILPKLFGESVSTYSIHAIRHLPGQVRQFGPLWCSSASLFESAFGILTSFVTGSRIEAPQIIRRLITHQSMHSTTQLKSVHIDRFGVSAHTALKSVPQKVQDLHQLQSLYQTSRIFVDGKIFTSYNYIRKGSSASHFAVTNRNGSYLFLKIDYIVLSSDNVFLCLCVEFKSRQCLSDFFDKRVLPNSLHITLCSNCSIYKLTEYGRVVIPAHTLCSQFISYTYQNDIFAIPVLCDFEHD